MYAVGKFGVAVSSFEASVSAKNREHFEIPILQKDEGYNTMSKEKDIMFSKRLLEISRANKTIFIDETGDVGPDSDPQIFGYAAAITTQEEDVAEIARKKREELGVDELKYRLVEDDIRRKVVEELIKTDIAVLGVYIDKKAKDNPEIWNKKERRSKIFYHSLIELSADLMEEDIDGADIVMDEHSALGENKGKNIVEIAAVNKRNLGKVTQENSKVDFHKDFMQGADFAIGEFGKKAEKGIDSKIPLKIRRLTNNDKK